MISTTDKRVVIVGGGISGLATAYYLSTHGLRPTLIEKEPRLGGLIGTDRVNGCNLEAGPDSFIASKSAVAELASELGIENQIIGSNDAQRRVFIVRSGQLVPMPKGMSMMVPGEFGAAFSSPLLSWRAKLGFLAEYAHAPKHRSIDISIKDFIGEHFGSELLDYLAEPLLSGVYGGDIGALSARSVLPRFLEYEERYGSLIRAVRANRPAGPSGSLFQSFANGMQSLTDALTSAMAGKVDCVRSKATNIERSGDRWRVVHTHGQLDADHVVLACPAYATAELIQSVHPAIAEELHGIPYSSAIVAMLVYDRAQLQRTLDGFGFLVPRPERSSIAAATWVSTKFSGRTPPDKAALRAFIVGKQAEALMERSDEQIVQAAREDFSRFMGVQTEPQFHTIHRWPLSMPQYVVGHAARMLRIQNALARHPGLQLCGNAYEGVGVPDCVRMAKRTAAHILAA